MMTKYARQSLRAQKAIRSAAAKKGWETRRALATGFVDGPSAPMIDAIRMHAAMTAPISDPNPWPKIGAALRGWWWRVTGWLR